MSYHSFCANNTQGQTRRDKIWILGRKDGGREGWKQPKFNRSYLLFLVMIKTVLITSTLLLQPSFNSRRNSALLGLQLFTLHRSNPKEGVLCSR